MAATNKSLARSNKSPPGRDGTNKHRQRGAIPLGVCAISGVFFYEFLSERPWPMLVRLAFLCTLPILLEGCADDLSCSIKETQELVFQIAKEHDTETAKVIYPIYNKNKPPMSAELTAAERNLKSIEKQLSQESGLSGFGYVPLSTFVLNPTPRFVALEQVYRQAKKEIAPLEAEHERQKDAAFSRMLADGHKRLKYGLDAIRTTDKNGAGVLSCAADLKANIGEYGNWAMNITYKVERTSDGRLYASVRGLTSN